MQEDLQAIAPVVHLAVDYEKGIVESTKANVQTIASIFGKEAKADTMFTDFQPRIDALKTVLGGKDVLLGMYNASALGLMGTASQLNPEYMFILDRSTATQAADGSVMGVREVIENDLIKELDVYKNDKIVYFIEHANVWYTSTGGVQALDTMLTDLEEALLPK